MALMGQTSVQRTTVLPKPSSRAAPDGGAMRIAVLDRKSRSPPHRARQLSASRCRSRESSLGKGLNGQLIVTRDVVCREDYWATSLPGHQVCRHAAG